MDPWNWETYPIVADSTLIRASTIMDIYAAIDDTRAGIPSAGSLVTHQFTHARGGTDAIQGPLWMSNYNYYGMNGAFMSSDPVSRYMYLSNNARMSGSGAWVKENSTTDSSVVKIAPSEIKFGHLPSTGSSPTYRATFNSSTGSLVLNGELSVLSDSSIDGDLVVTGEISASNLDSLTLPDPLSIKKIIIGSGGTASNSGVSVLVGDVSVSTGSVVSNYGDISLLRSNGVKITPSSAGYDNQIFQIYGKVNTSQHLCIIPEITVGGSTKNFEILLTNDSDVYMTPRGTLGIESSVLKLQSYLPTQKLLIGPGATGDNGLMDISGEVVVYNRSNSKGVLRLDDNDEYQNCIVKDSTYNMFIYGGKYSSGVKYLTDRVIHASDKLIVGDGYNGVSWTNNGYDSGARLWIPYGSEFYNSGVLSDGYMSIGTMESYNLSFDSRGIQARNKGMSFGSPEESVLYLNPLGGNVYINSSQSSSEKTGPTLRVYGMNEVYQANTMDSVVQCGARTSRFDATSENAIAIDIDSSSTMVSVDCDLIRSDGKWLKGNIIVISSGDSIVFPDPGTPVNNISGSSPIGTEVSLTATLTGNLLTITANSDSTGYGYNISAKVTGNNINTITWLIG